MTFKDEMRAAGKKAGDAAPAQPSAAQADSNDIAKLLRVLNEDLRADPADDVAVLEDEVDAKAERHLPVGKIAAALVAAAGIGVAVVMFDQGADVPPPAPPPLIAAAPSTAVPPPATTGGASPALTRAPAAQPEPLIARAPLSAAPATTAPAAAPLVAPPPPAVALPQTPPPALKVPEPPQAAVPVEPTTTTTVPVTAPVSAPEPAKAAAPPPAPAEEPVKPVPAAKPAEAAELQAMLAPKAPARAPGRPDSKPSAAPAAPAAPPQAAKPIVLTPPAVPSVPDGHFAVQVGTFQIAENADALLRRLRDGGYTAQVVDWTDTEQRSWHAVRVGGYADRATAKRAADSLKARMGLPAMVVGTR